jgi:hypothetical protein
MHRPTDNPQQGSTFGINNSNTMTMDHQQYSSSEEAFMMNQADFAGAFAPPARPTRGPKIPPTQRDARKLFVGGLPANITEEEFRAFFEQFGAVADSIVMIDRETRRSRGFGFVTFEDPNVARQLLDARVPDMDHVEGVGRVYMQTKLCEIKAAEPKGPGGFYGGRGGGFKQQRRPRGGQGWSQDVSGINPGVPSSLHHYDTPMMYPPPPPTMYYPSYDAPQGGYGHYLPSAPTYYETDSVTTNYGSLVLDSMPNGYITSGMPSAHAPAPMMGGYALQPAPVGLGPAVWDGHSNQSQSSGDEQIEQTTTNGESN